MIGATGGRLKARKWQPILRNPSALAPLLRNHPDCPDESLAQPTHAATPIGTTAAFRCGKVRVVPGRIAVSIRLLIRRPATGAMCVRGPSAVGPRNFAQLRSVVCREPAGNSRTENRLRTKPNDYQTNREQAASILCLRVSRRAKTPAVLRWGVAFPATAEFQNKALPGSASR